MADESTDSPLAGVRVLDLSRVVSGPFATQLLTDLGAEVVRVEPIPPRPHITAGSGVTAGLTEEEAFSWGLGRNKRSVSIDLKQREGRDLLCRLAAVSDVVFDNFRPAVTRRLGIDHAALTEVSPRIVTCSLTGFGEWGPWSTMPAYDPIVQAMSGTMSFTRLDEDGPPVRWGIPIGDLLTGLFSAIGIVGALIQRDRGGVGQHVDVSMLDVMLAMNTYRVPLALTFAQEPKPAPFEGGQGTVPFGNFECSDGWLALGVSQRAWRSACAVLGRPELADDERFATARARHTHNGALVEILQTTLKGRNADEWQADFLSAGVVAGKVTSIADVFDHPQVRARGMAAGLSDESGRTATVAGDPLKLSDPARWRAPSHTGADTAAVLSSLLGLRAHIIDGLADRGVVYRPRRPDGTLTTSDYTPQPCGRVTESDVGAHDRALSGVVVLELSGDEPSKAFAAQVLADLGARVIRVEPPAAEISEPYPDDDRRSAFRSGLGRGKESVAADLKSPEGRDLYRALVEHADVVLDNYRPGVLQRLQIDQDWLHTVNPTAISCSITGYGHSGPWRSYPAFDNAVQALGGGMSITADHTAPQTPVRWGNPIGGLTGSLYAALGILGAIRVRNRIGATRRIDLSLLDAQVALLSYRVPQAVTLGRKFVPEPRRGGSGSLPFGVFKTADHRWFVLGITAQFWGEFCRVAGCPEAEFDPRFTTEAQRRGHERQLNAMIEGQMLTRTAGEWERLFFDHRLPGATVVTLSEAFNHPQAVERAMRLTVPDELHTTGVDAANLPIKFSATAPPRPAPGPLPGADTARIALEVGLGQPNRAAGGRVDAPP